MLPTPDTSHVSFENIYEPSEDSFLLLDALSSASEAQFLAQRFFTEDGTDSPLVLEVGSGSGLVLAFIAANARTILGRSDILLLGADVSAFACSATEQTVRVNSSASSKRQAQACFLGTVCADLTSAVKKHSVDLLVFNPPYVPSEAIPVNRAEFLDVEDKFQRDSNHLALATDGGSDGMEVTCRLLAQLPSLLSGRGVAYVLLCAQNKPDMVKSKLRHSDHKWSVETVKTSGSQGGWERLQIIRIAKDTRC